MAAALQRALAAGSGLTIDPEVERVSGADELFAFTLPELVRLAALALIADGPDWPEDCARAARHAAAAVLRLEFPRFAGQGWLSGSSC